MIQLFEVDLTFNQLVKKMLKQFLGVREKRRLEGSI